jgi:hypothetical protein
VRPTVDERELCSSHKVFDRPRHQHLAGSRHRLYARRDMHSKATHIGATPLDLSAVQSATDLEAHAPEPITEREGTSDRPGGPIECREQPVSRCFHERASVATKLPLGEPIVCIEDVPPTLIAEFGGLLGRADDVCEQDRRQHPVGINECPHPCEELLHLVGDRLHVADPQREVA